MIVAFLQLVELTTQKSKMSKVFIQHKRASTMVANTSKLFSGVREGVLVRYTVDGFFFAARRLVGKKSAKFKVA